MKYAECAEIRAIEGNWASTTLDAVRGFSGAPIFVVHQGEAHLAAVHKASKDLLPPAISVAARCGSAVIGAKASTEACCERHGEAWDEDVCGPVPEDGTCDETPTVCCDDFRVVASGLPDAQPGVGQCAAEGPRTTRTSQGCRSLPTCREEGCCKSNYDSRGPIFAEKSALAAALEKYSDEDVSCDYGP